MKLGFATLHPSLLGLSRARLWHLGLAVALCVTSVGLAIVAGLVLVAYFAVRRGVVHKFLELGARNDESIRRLLGRFPAPDPADLKSSRKAPMEPQHPNSGGR